MDVMGMPQKPPAYPGDIAVERSAHTAPVATAFPATVPVAAPAAQVFVAPAVVSSDLERLQAKRTATNFRVTLILMTILLVFGVFMLTANTYTAGKGVKTYDNYRYGNARRTKVRRDWDQGIWSGTLHIVVAAFFVVLYVKASNAGFNLHHGSLRGTSYFFCICVGLLSVAAFIAMVMSGVTAAFLDKKDTSYTAPRCYTGRGSNGSYCYCKFNDEYVAKATCSEAAGVYHGLFSTIAVLNAISVMLTIIAGIYACMGSSTEGCCGSNYYSSSAVVMAAPAQVVQTVPQVGVAYPTQGQVTTTY